MTRILLILALLATPAHAGKTSLEKLPSCAPGVMVVQAEPDIVFHPVYIKPKKMYGMLNIFFAQELLKPCKTPGLRRSIKDAKCYRKGRMP